MSDIILWKQPVIDRSESDIQEVNALKSLAWDDMSSEQKAKWSRGLKGALNQSDLNRIENNIHLLSDVLELNLVTKENEIPLVPTLSYWSRLLGNVARIRISYSTHSDTPKVPVQPVNNYKQINDIEKILLDIYNIILTNFFYESIDELHCGEEVGLVL